MRTALIATVAAAVLTASPAALATNPEADLNAFRAHFQERFPDTPFNDYINGIYSIDAPSREQWEAIEEFPPYETSIDAGEAMWGEPFANGNAYATCFGDDVSAVRPRYPHYDAARDEVVTLELAINECRRANGEKPLKYRKGPMADLSAFIAYQGRGHKIDIKVDSDGAMKWYERGRKHFYAKRGQLNLSCADCHQYYAGNYVRADRLSPALGQTTHFPVYRSKWGNLGTLHRRYVGCNQQVRFKALKPQSAEYRALEYFHTYMANGLEWNGPGARK